MRYKFGIVILAVCVGLSASSHAAFTPDEFDGPNLGPQWTFGDSTPAGTSHTLTDGHLNLTAPAGTDLFHFVDTYGYVQQDAPAGTNWEVVVKIDNYDPTVAGQQRDFARCGMQLWQDNNHHILLSLLSSGSGLELGTQTMWQNDPDNDPANDGVYWGAIDIFNFGPKPSYWIKLQKTPKGYIGLISSDNTTWLNFMSVVKNPETPDGYFTNEKIRLFDTGGFGGGELTTATFDYIHSAAIPPPVSGYQDDEFNGSELGSNWGYHPGIGVGFQSFHNGSLSLTAGIFADVWVGREQTTFVYQDAPTSSSFNLTTKVAPTEFTQVGYELFNCYGIWLWHDQSNWIFISNQRGEIGSPPTPNNRIEAAFKRQGLFDSTTVPFGTGDCPGYLRVEKVGSLSSVQYSFDNVNWTTISIPDGSQFNIGDNNLQVRLFSKRAFGDGTPIDAEFDWLHSAVPAAADVNDWQLY